MAKHDLQTLLEMSQKDMQIALTTTVTEANLVKQGVKVTFGFDKEYGEKLMRSMATGDGKYIAVAIVVNKEQFDEISKS